MRDNKESWINTQTYIHGKLENVKGNVVTIMQNGEKMLIKTKTNQSDILRRGHKVSLFVKAEQRVRDGKLRNLELVDNYEYAHDYDDTYLRKILQRASNNSEALDIDAFLKNMK